MIRKYSPSCRLFCKYENGKWALLTLQLRYSNYSLKDIYSWVLFLFLAALGLRCCTRAFSSCGERGLLFVVVRGLLTAVASLVGENRFQARRFQ